MTEGEFAHRADRIQRDGYAVLNPWLSPLDPLRIRSRAGRRSRGVGPGGRSGPDPLRDRGPAALSGTVAVGTWTRSARGGVV